MPETYPEIKNTNRYKEVPSQHITLSRRKEIPMVIWR